MSVDFSTDEAGARAQKREAILTAAAKAFLTVGFERANMDEIAGQADVSKRTIYAHYVSKDGLFEAVVTAMVSRVQKSGEVGWDGRRSVEDQLLEIARGKLVLFEDRHFSGLARMVIGVFAAQPDLARRALSALEQCDHGIVNWIRSAQAAGRLRGVDAEEADEFFGALVMSTLVWPILAGQPIDRDTQRARVEAIATMFGGWLDRRGSAE